MHISKKNIPLPLKMVFACGRHANFGSVESFFRTHKYLVEHLGEPIRRKLMDMVDWNHRLIGIKGTRGVGKTTFLLQYAKANFDVSQKDCLYVNMNHFVFTQRTLVDFAEEFRLRGGKTLLIDQIFKYANWSRELRMCYDRFPDLKIVFTGSTVMQIGKNNPDLEGIVKVYNIRGFSFREFLNLTIGTDFRAYSFQEVIQNHRAISSEICRQIKPLAHFRDYVHHGYYPFFLEKRNFSENLLKTMNMMLEVDVLVVKQIEQSYLPKLRKLFYLLAQSAPGAPNISQLSVDCDISRATVTNYIEYLKAARLINTLYRDNEEFPKKPDTIYMHNPNLLFPIRQTPVEEQAIRETFLYNQLHHDDCRINKGDKSAQFLVRHPKMEGETFRFRVDAQRVKSKRRADVIYAVEMMEEGEGNVIPLWLFGFLY